MTGTETISTSTAAARLQVSYGMTELGSQRVLAAARRNGATETAAVRVTFVAGYLEWFLIAAKA